MKLLNQTRDFASRAVNLAKLSHIFMTAPPGVAGVAGRRYAAAPASCKMQLKKFKLSLL